MQEPQSVLSGGMGWDGPAGSSNFTDVRTSIATHAKNTHSPSNYAFLSAQAKNTHSPGDRHKVAHFMCHDTSTADKFYALNLDAKQAAEQRRLFEAAVDGEDVPPERPAASSGPKVAKRTRKRPPPQTPAQRSRQRTARGSRLRRRLAQRSGA